MKKLRNDAGLDVRAAYAFRLARALALRQQPDLERIVDEATRAVIDTDRALFDRTRPTQEAVVDRELARTELDDTARVVARELAARGPRANKESPYVDLFPDGLSGYTTATHDEVLYTYHRLVARMEQHLPPDDPTRVRQVPALRAKMGAWQDADRAADRTQADLDDAREARQAAIASWDRAVDQAYGLLVSRVGRPTAEQWLAGVAKREARASAPAPVPPAEATCPVPAEASPTALAAK